jgi:SAM-dependent methyltransferase
MKKESRFEARYINGDLPWDVKRADSSLTILIENKTIPRGRVLEIGCGTGDNSIWLAQQKFEVTACDVSVTAIKLAKEKAQKNKVDCNFMVADFLNESISGGLFDFVFDRGCFHSFRKKKERLKIARNVSSHLNENGLWLSLMGSADAPPREIGPPMLSAKNIVDAVEKYFEVISLTKSHFETDQPNPAPNWVCLMKKRRKD